MARSRDFLRPMRVDGVMETQGNPFLCHPDTRSTLRKEEVKELISKTKLTLKYGSCGGGGLGGSSGVQRSGAGGRDPPFRAGSGIQL